MSAWKAAPSAFTARSGGKSRRASIIRDKVRTVHDFSLLINLNDVILPYYWPTFSLALPAVWKCKADTHYPWALVHPKAPADNCPTERVMVCSVCGSQQLFSFFFLRITTKTHIFSLQLSLQQWIAVPRGTAPFHASALFLLIFLCVWIFPLCATKGCHYCRLV